MVKFIHGYVTMGRELAEQTAERNRIFDDIVAGRREWDSSKVDWDAIEEMYEDFGNRCASSKNGDDVSTEKPIGELSNGDTVWPGPTYVIRIHGDPDGYGAKIIANLIEGHYNVLARPEHPGASPTSV